MTGTRLAQLEASRRRARRVGTAGLAIAAALPIVLWHTVIGTVVAEFELDANYLLSGVLPFALMTLGLACAVPIWVAELRDRERRFYRQGTAAWAGWGVSLYVLGFALATQVAQIFELGVGAG